MPAEPALEEALFGIDGEDAWDCGGELGCLGEDEAVVGLEAADQLLLLTSPFLLESSSWLFREGGGKVGAMYGTTLFSEYACVCSSTVETESRLSFPPSWLHQKLLAATDRNDVIRRGIMITLASLDEVKS